MKKTMFIAKAVSDNSIIFKGNCIDSIERQIKYFLDNHRKNVENIMGETVIENAEYPYNVLTKEKGMWHNVHYVVRYKIRTKDGKVTERRSQLTVNIVKTLEY